MHGPWQRLMWYSRHGRWSARSPSLDVDRAGPEREQPADEVHRLVHRRRGCVRPEVARPVVHELARPLDAREVVGERDLDVRVALVVLEPDVEPRPEALDEVRLEQQGLGHRIGQGVLDVGDAVDHFPDPVDVTEGARRRLLLPVRAHPAAEALRLADVQHVAALILEQVDARPVGQSLEGRLELRGHRTMLGQVGRTVAGPGWSSAPAHEQDEPADRNPRADSGTRSTVGRRGSERLNWRAWSGIWRSTDGLAGSPSSRPGGAPFWAS